MNFEKIIDFLKDKISTFLEICKRLFSLFMVKVFNPLRTKVDYFQCKYLHKGQLKKFVIIRYIVKELTLYFLVCFLFFFMIFFVNQILLLAEQILKQRVPFADVARLMLYCLPGVISQSAPFATLVGFLMCLGRLMSDNEILIFRASGQSYKLVLIPVLVLGMVISIVSFFVNDYLLPVGNMKFSKLKREIAVANPTIEIESNSIKRLKNSTIIIGDVNDKEVSDIVFFDKGSDGNQRIVVAGKSEIQNAQKEGVIMHMNMNDAVVTLLDRKNKKNFDVLDSKTATLNVFDSAVFTNTTSVSPREMTSYDLGKRIKNLEKSKNASKRQLNNYKMEY
ncbi:MAG: LptF/LptG family permease, partial [Treponema sp.]|nr:LptF/LptG family permease [Treponema sp.]